MTSVAVLPGAALSAVLAASMWMPVLLQEGGAEAGEGGAEPSSPPQVKYEYKKPFLQPLPVWRDAAWPWLLVPLCGGVAVVYKSIKCRYARQIPREAAVLSVWILLGMAAAAAVLAAVVKALER
jgi:hypothetical protein